MKETKLLTVKFNAIKIAEFHVSSELLGARNSSELIHHFVLGKIREARAMVSAEEFESLVNAKLAEMNQRGQSKSNRKSPAESAQVDADIPRVIPKGLTGTASSDPAELFPEILEDEDGESVGDEQNGGASDNEKERRRKSS